MTPKESTTARPWFICPSWAAVVPLLLHPLTTAPDSDEAAAAAAELQNLARGLDQWNEKAPELLRLLGLICTSAENDENEDAHTLATRARLLLEGKQ